MSGIGRASSLALGEFKASMTHDPCGVFRILGSFPVKNSTKLQHIQ